MIRTSAPFASWILQRQLTEMKEAAVTAMRHVGELADLVRFLPGFFGSITSHVKKRTSWCEPNFQTGRPPSPSPRRREASIAFADDSWPTKEDEESTIYIKLAV